MDAGIYRMLEVMLRDLEFGLEESSEFVQDTLLALEVQGQISRLRKILANNKPGRRIRGPGPPPMGETKARRRGKGRKRKTAYQAAYSKAFKRVAPNYKKKDGGWRKGGFAAAGRAARRDPAVRKVKKK